MTLRKLDRQQWTFDEAVDYVAEIIKAEKEDAKEKVLEPAYAAPPWLTEAPLADRPRTIARNELLVALRDGDLHATGRLSTTRANRAAPPFTEWTLHSGHDEPISPAQWRSGEFRTGCLRLVDGEFIDIRLPRFMVRVIWPKAEQAVPPHGTDYSTPYLDLLGAAIAEFAITNQRQPKKDNLVDWFRRQTVEGEILSENLASAMATLVRLPSSQRGGAKRSW
jgi:hypothetical protein